MCTIYMQILYTTLYKGLQHPGVLVSKGGPGTNP